MLEKGSCMLIQKLLRFQTIPGPYLGANSGPIAQTKVVPFDLARLSQKSNPNLLQSKLEQIQIQYLKPEAKNHPQRPDIALSPESTQLCKTTLQVLRQHPVKIPEQILEKTIQSLEVIAPASQESGVDTQHQVLLSFIALERPFEKVKSSKRKNAPAGTPFMEFVFEWEKETLEEQSSEEKP
jgi:hypothetical protein